MSGLNGLHALRAIVTQQLDEHEKNTSATLIDVTELMDSFTDNMVNFPMYETELTSIGNNPEHHSHILHNDVESVMDFLNLQQNVMRLTIHSIAYRDAGITKSQIAYFQQKLPMCCWMDGVASNKVKGPILVTFKELQTKVRPVFRYCILQMLYLYIITHSEMQEDRLVELRTLFRDIANGSNRALNNEQQKKLLRETNQKIMMVF